MLRKGWETEKSLFKDSPVLSCQLLLDQGKIKDGGYFMQRNEASDQRRAEEKF